MCQGRLRIFGPLEEAIWDWLLPALLAIPRTDIGARFRQVLTYSVKTGGLAVRNPVETAVANHATSRGAAKHLVKSLVDNGTPFFRREHTLTCAAAAKAAQTSRLFNKKAFMTWKGRDGPKMREQDAIACAL